MTDTESESIEESPPSPFCLHQEWGIAKMVYEPDDDMNDLPAQLVIRTYPDKINIVRDYYRLLPRIFRWFEGYVNELPHYRGMTKAELRTNIFGSLIAFDHTVTSADQHRHTRAIHSSWKILSSKSYLKLAKRIRAYVPKPEYDKVIWYFHFDRTCADRDQGDPQAISELYMY